MTTKTTIEESEPLTHEQAATARVLAEEAARRDLVHPELATPTTAQPVASHPEYLTQPNNGPLAFDRHPMHRDTPVLKGSPFASNLALNSGKLPYTEVQAKELIERMYQQFPALRLWHDIVAKEANAMIDEQVMQEEAKLRVAYQNGHRDFWSERLAALLDEVMSGPPQEIPPDVRDFYKQHFFQTVEMHAALSEHKLVQLSDLDIERILTWHRWVATTVDYHRADAHICARDREIVMRLGKLTTVYVSPQLVTIPGFIVSTRLHRDRDPERWTLVVAYSSAGGQHATQTIQIGPFESIDRATQQQAMLTETETP